MTNVMIADDHPVVRTGLGQILSDVDDITVCAEAGTGDEVVESIAESGADVLLLDINMPGTGGIDTLKQVKECCPNVAVLILSMYPEDQYAMRLLKSGAAGYLTKESAPDQLVDAIRKVARGGRYVSPTLAEILANNISGDDERAAHELLSNREYQIFCMLASGKLVSEVAEELGLSIKTVSTYRSRILDKMQMSKNAELTYYAVKNQLIE